MTSKRLATVLPLFVTALTCLAASPVLAQFAPEPVPVAGAWGPNGHVNDSIVVGDTLFLGGDFDYIGPPTGAFATADAADGSALVVSPPGVRDTFSAASDGAGGWFVSSDRYRVPVIRHIRADGTVDPTFVSPSITKGTFPVTVNGLAVAGGRLYVYGDFEAVNSAVRRGIASLDPATGTVTAWDAQLASTASPAPGIVYVNRAAVDGDILYFTGFFDQVSGQARTGMAAIDGATGALRAATFANTPGASVQYISAAGGRVYVSGSCNPTPTTFAYVCAYTSDGTRIPGWAGVTPDLGGVLVATPSRIYIAGTVFLGFGNSETRVRGFDPVTGAPDGWQSPRIGDLASGGYGAVGAMTATANHVYVGGYIVSAGGVRRNRYAAFDATTGALTPWYPAVAGEPTSLATDGARIAITGSFSSAGGRLSPHLAALDVRTGLPLSLALPAIPAPVNALAASGALVVAGAGTEVVAFSATTGALRTRFDVSAPGRPVGTVRALAIAEPLLFVGGNFVDVLGQPRQHLAAIDMRTGQPTSFDPRPDNQVLRLRVSSGALYAVGRFSAVPGYGRGGVAAWDISRGTLEAFSPPVSGTSDLAFFRDRVLLAGAFDPPYYASQGTRWVDRVSGTLLSLGRSVPFTAAGIARTGNTIVVGGNPRPGWRGAGLVALDAMNGSLLDWAPLVDSRFAYAIIGHVQATERTVVISGQFDVVEGVPAYNLAIFRTGRAASPRQMTAAVSNGTVSLGWQPGVGPQARSYVLEAGTTAGASDVGTFAVGAVTRATGVLAPGTYFIRVRGVGDTGPGPAGSEVIVSVPSTSTPPSAPGPLSASVSGRVVTLSWGAAAGNATSYVIEAGTAAGLTNIGVLPTGHLDTTWSAAAPPGTYVVRVRAANAFGLSAPTSDVTVVVP